MGLPVLDSTRGWTVNPKNGGNDPMLNWVVPAEAAAAAKRVKRSTTASAVAKAGVFPDRGVKPVTRTIIVWPVWMSVAEVLPRKAEPLLSGKPLLSMKNQVTRFARVTFTVSPML